MTYRILQLHHGSIDVQSKVGRGTEFSLRIPLAATEWGRRHLQPAICGRDKGVGDMKLSARSAAWLLPLLLTGCFHKTQVAQNQPLAPPIEDTPPPKPEPAADESSSAGGDDSGAAGSRRSRRRGAGEEAREAQEASEHQHASGVKRDACGVGDRPAFNRRSAEHAAADRCTRSNRRKRALNGINRKLNDQEQKTAAQIREFLKQARDALQRETWTARNAGDQGEGAAGRAASVGRCDFPSLFSMMIWFGSSLCDRAIARPS